MYKINEIFYSLQGEGRWTGSPAVFIRFAGCNLACSFCDTDFVGFTEMKIPDIMEVVKQYPAKMVVLTGGEPLLQLHQDDELIVALLRSGKELHLETNGTIEVPGGIGWVTVSPKKDWRIKEGHELKVVYTGQQNLEKYFYSDFIYYYLQPCSGENIQEVVEICKNDPRWSLSLQTHKMLKIR